MTPYHAKVLAYELTRRRSSDSHERLTAAVAGAQVDMNPHQVDAAMFAFASPLSKGALLADEVGLGKTIEAGLVISQLWAEGKRRILIIAPSSLRKQWHQELAEKFFIPAKILDGPLYNTAVKSGEIRPFDLSDQVAICSYHFARNKVDDIRMVPWDLVIIDEAHRLRNVYKKSNIIATTLRDALQDRDKLLLTATPLQNSLLELYGLVSFVDEHIFGDLKSFREQFSNLSQDRTFALLRERLQPVCHRTLRRQVTAYVPYTKRHAILQEFTPDEPEDQLYELISAYLQRPNLQALPSGQRSLMTLVLRKLLASSSFAIAGALQTIASRLQTRLDASELSDELELAGDYSAFDVTADEWIEEEESLTVEDIDALQSEISELREFAALASSITQNAKGRALISALDVAFGRARETAAPEKAIIFTESRRTQNYLLKVLGDSDYSEGIVLFNGSNTDEKSKAIYAEWLESNKGTDRLTGSRAADMRSALVDYFRDEGRIMIATEAGAEGINLQFCSMVVNYDLPWNPQRVEQRIGRCHRYGQKHDVVVVNFLNRKNQADQRVYQLLNEKFRLFEGVFGASDEVLGAIESGVDFEKRIAGIYQKCRQPEDIRLAFDELQQELSHEIDQAMRHARKKLLENFDDEVREKLRICDDDTKVHLNKFESQLIELARFELDDFAEMRGSSSFLLKSLPNWVSASEVPLGLYELPRRSGEAHLFRLAHPLGQAVVDRAKTRNLESAHIIFDYSTYEGRVTSIEPFIGANGYAVVKSVSFSALGQTEDRLVVAALTDEGTPLPVEAANRLFTVSGTLATTEMAIPRRVIDTLNGAISERSQQISAEISERNAEFFEREAAKLDGWADDLKVGLEREIRDLDREIKDARRSAKAALTLEDKLKGQKAVRELENKRSKKRRTLFDAQDQIDEKREELISTIEEQLEQVLEENTLFRIKWSLQ
ncbi:SNF2-related protein [Altererythrobacter sp. ZODW24]|uniref:SNF2-related protein n=1 Tax=Altererythrobacter sp. ZODW24 TaxID=2185142 RepID=UPI000DF7AF82|nr:SNF2-related protein [Altererythrobacter sp. ZODW24]